MLVPSAVRTPIAAPGARHDARYRLASASSARCGNFRRDLGRGGRRRHGSPRHRGRGSASGGRDDDSCSDHQIAACASDRGTHERADHQLDRDRTGTGIVDFRRCRIAMSMTRPPRDRFERESRREIGRDRRRQAARPRRPAGSSRRADRAAEPARADRRAPPDRERHARCAPSRRRQRASRRADRRARRRSRPAARRRVRASAGATSARSSAATRTCSSSVSARRAEQLGPVGSG